MLITESNSYKIGDTLVAAIGYGPHRFSRVFVKNSDTGYRLSGTRKIYSYKSLHTKAKAMKNASV